MEAEDNSKLDLATWRAVEQLHLAYENSVRSWITTAISLITFGFSVSRFADILRPGADKSNYQLGTQTFSLALVIIGLAALTLGVIENRNSLRALAAVYPVKKRSVSVTVAGLVALLGVGALVAMILRP
jgi:putative membrane protein